MPKPPRSPGLRALEALGLGEGTHPDAVRAAYRALSKTAHPDVGGDPSAFDRLHSDYALALAYAKGAVCPRCAGSAIQRIARGFSVVSVRCEPCGGTGKLHR
jgi:DnaJ-class molecular chaperone